MKFTSPDPTTRRNQIRTTRDNLAALVETFQTTRENTPAETVTALVNRLGYDTAAEAVAELVSSVGEWDGRIFGLHSCSFTFFSAGRLLTYITTYISDFCCASQEDAQDSKSHASLMLLLLAVLSGCRSCRGVSPPAYRPHWHAHPFREVIAYFACGHIPSGRLFNCQGAANTKKPGIKG